MQQMASEGYPTANEHKKEVKENNKCLILFFGEFKLRVFFFFFFFHNANKKASNKYVIFW